MMLAALGLLAGCATKPVSAARLVSRDPADSKRIITILAEAKYYLSRVPPGLVIAELYGDEAALGVYGDTNIDGVILEIIDPKEYAGRIYTLRGTRWSLQPNSAFALGSLYELRIAASDIGKFSFQATTGAQARKLTLEEAKKRSQKPGGPITDDLQWLVGRWRCVTREWLVPWDGPLGTACEDSLDYFNVYFPFADDRLTLKLTDNPEDRPIAAEFLVRHVRGWLGNEFEEELVPMIDSGPVRISKDRIRTGQTFETTEFKYYRREGRNSVSLLVLESDFMRLELYKVADDLGDIKKSFVQAPIKNYSPDQISDLRTRYQKLTQDEKPGKEHENRR